MTRDQFMNAFRDDDNLCEELSDDDCREVFSGILKGESDLTWELFEETCINYGVDFEDIAKAYVKEVEFRRDVARRATAIDWDGHDKLATKGKDKS